MGLIMPFFVSINIMTLAHKPTIPVTKKNNENGNASKVFGDAEFMKIHPIDIMIKLEGIPTNGSPQL